MVLRTQADVIYASLLSEIMLKGKRKVTRNSPTFSSFRLPKVIFDKTPLITWRKTAWKTALAEWAWFMSGEDECPQKLLPWWEKQLDKEGWYSFGYPHQFRHFSDETNEGFDQIDFLLRGIKESPNSRRLCMTTWNPEEMASITTYNSNQNTPTCCHSNFVQFFVEDGELHMLSVQRSADMLLGVPHNWIQSWGFLLYMAYHTGLKAGTLQWTFGDAHIYDEESHKEVVRLITHSYLEDYKEVELIYEPKEIILDAEGVPIFSENDFRIEGDIPVPVTTIRPTLFE